MSVLFRYSHAEVVEFL